MTYKNLKKLLSENSSLNIEIPFDLMSCDIKSKSFLSLDAAQTIPLAFCHQF